jgi:hypothetical protein
MNSYGGKLFVAVIVCLTVVFSANLNSGAEAKDSVLSSKTLNRWVDFVTMSGGLASEEIGSPVSNLRLYAYRNGVFEPIRYQIDEMTEDGDWIFTEGPLPNKDLSNGKLDPWDTITFMASDTGDRISKETFVPGCTKSSEIEIIDPITGEKGWVYVLYFPSDPPNRSALPDYVRYNYNTATVDTDYWQCKYIITKDGLHSTFYESEITHKQAGGSGENFVDRFKVRISLKLLFSAITFRLNEEQVGSNVLAYKHGPIKLITRTEQYVNGPGGLKIGRGVIDTQETSIASIAPLLIDIPFRLDRVVSSLTFRTGTDYNENAFGAKVYNSNNLQGFLVDGKMDDGEKNFNPAADEWRLMVGKAGILMSSTVYPPEFLKYLDRSAGLIDDITKKDPPETYPGCIGYLWQDWNVGKVPKGKYYLFVYFYQPANPKGYTPGYEIPFMNYQNKQLKIRGGGKEETNRTQIIANIGKRYK